MSCCDVPHSTVDFFLWSFVAYSAACLGHILHLVTEKRPVGFVATGLMAAGFLFHTAAIVMRTIAVQRIPLANMFEYLNLFIWFLGLSYFVALYFFRRPVLGAFVGPVIFMLMTAASLLPKETEMQLVPALQSRWLQIHVTVAALGEAAFAVGFAAAVMFLLKNGLAPGSRLAARLPEAESLDRVSYKAITVGYPLFTIGALFAGAIWAEQAWGSFWSWDPKEVGSLVVWLVYSAYLHARLVKGWSGKRAAILGIIGFLCTLLTFFANLFLSGLHAYG